MMQIIQGAFLMSIVLYAVMTKILPAGLAPDVLLFKMLSLLSIVTVAAIFLLRGKLVKSAEQILSVQPDDTAALARWRTGYLITYAFSECYRTLRPGTAFYGLCLCAGPALLYCRLCNDFVLRAAATCSNAIAGARLHLRNARRIRCFHAPARPISSEIHPQA
jgi:hypothetical protein